MNIQWLGQSAFKLVESTGTTIITDPFVKNDVGYDMSSVIADIVTRSNNTTLMPASISGDALVIDSEGFYDVEGVHILCVGDHNTLGANGDYDNLIFKFRMDGVDVCHLGHVKNECSVELSESIGSVDVLLVPVGGGDTINADMAKGYVKLLMPDVVIPMSFKTRECNQDIDKVDVFLRKLEDYEVVFSSSAIEFDRTEFEGEETKIIVFNK